MMLNLKKRTLPQWLGIGTIFVLGVVCGVVAYSVTTGHTSRIQEKVPFREKDTAYTFINPLLFYEAPSDDHSPEYAPLVSEIKKTVDGFVKKNGQREVSVYYRDLTRGQWVGIHEDENYTPASLLKVVIMMAYFKSAESRTEYLSSKIAFSKDIKNAVDSIPYVKGTSLVLQQSYTVNELMEKMIIDSDDGAAFTLLSHLDEGILDHVFISLGLNSPKSREPVDALSPQDYASFLRVLYNATYLTRSMSERALELLSRSSFHDGLVANIPSSVRIAHKYGEAVVPGAEVNEELLELHDCGIVYYPLKPYILCVMTRGGPEDGIATLSGVIKEISNTVYGYVHSHNK